MLQKNYINKIPSAYYKLKDINSLKFLFEFRILHSYLGTKFWKFHYDYDVRTRIINFWFYASKLNYKSTNFALKNSKQKGWFKYKIKKINKVKFNFIKKIYLLSKYKSIYKKNNNYSRYNLYQLVFYTKKTNRLSQIYFEKYFHPRTLSAMKLPTRWRPLNKFKQSLHKVLKPKEWQIKNHFFKYHYNLTNIMRQSRQVHWEYTNKETLRKRSYIVFLRKEMKNNVKLKTLEAVTNIVGSLKIFISWKHLILGISLGLINLNGTRLNKDVSLKTGDIITFPKLYLQSKYNYYFKKKKKLRIREQKNRRYKYYKSKNIVWKTRKKALYKKTEYNQNFSFRHTATLHLDCLTSSVGILFYKKYSPYFINKNTRTQNLLKLNKWRFYYN